MLPKLAWKNLWRRKRRTLITMSSVAFGVWFSGTFIGVRNHSYGALIEGSVRMGLGHVSIEPRGYNLAPSFDKTLEDTAAVKERVAEVPGIASAIERISGPAIFSSAAGSAPGVILGVDPAKESAERNAYVAALSEGKIFSGTRGNGVVIGAVMADRLKLKLGSKLIYTAADANGEMISESARVEGIFKTGGDEADGAAVLLPIDRLRKSLKYSPGQATLVSIYLQDERAVNSAAAALRAKNFGAAEIFTWEETQPGIASYIALARHRTNVFLLLIVLVIGAGVLNTLLVSVMERKRELGVMLAVGTSPARLFRLIICEASFLATIGCLVGVTLFVPWMIYMQRVGIDLTSIIGADMQISGVLYDPVLRIALHAQDAIMIFLGLFIFVLATAAYPAQRAARLPPIESMNSA